MVMAGTSTDPFDGVLDAPAGAQPPVGSGQQQPDTGSGQVSTAEDLTREIGNRLAAAGPDILGAAGDLRDIVNKAGRVGVRAWRNLQGEEPYTPEQEAQKEAAYKSQEGPIGRMMDAIPNSDDIKRWLGYEPYQPATPAGKYVEKEAGPYIEMAPQAAIAGPESILKSVLKYDVAPQLLTEKVVDPVGKSLGLTPEAQQVLDTFAQIGTAGVAGLHEKPNYSNVPTGAAIRGAADAKFNNLEKSDFTVPRSSMRGVVSGLEDEFDKRGGLNQNYQPETFGLMQDLKDASARKSPMSYSEMEMHRVRAENAFDKAVSSGNANDINAAKIALSAVEGWMEKPTADFEAAGAAGTPLTDKPPEQWTQADRDLFNKALKDAGNDASKVDMSKLVSPSPGPTPAADKMRGDLPTQVQQWSQATDLAKLSRKVDAIQQAISGVGDVREGNENAAKAIQQNFSKLLTNPKTARLFTPKEQAEIRTVVNSSGGTQALMDTIAKYGGGAGAVIGFLHGDLGEAVQRAFEGTVASGAVKGLGKSQVGRLAHNVGAEVRSEYDPETGATQPMRKIPLRPGLRPALMVGGLYAARTNQTPQQEQQYNQMADPFDGVLQ